MGANMLGLSRGRQRLANSRVACRAEINLHGRAEGAGRKRRRLAGWGPSPDAWHWLLPGQRGDGHPPGRN